MRVGIGYDMHRLVPERKLILGGVSIEHPLGLLGHSDADVVSHAIADALLGAAALGDIGLHFPDGDPEYKDVSSLLLLQNVSELLRQCGWQIINVDSVIIAEQPKLSPYLAQMQEQISGALGISLDLVSVKATTTEGLGPCGHQEGIASQAVALIEEAKAKKSAKA